MRLFKDIAEITICSAIIVVSMVALNRLADMFLDWLHTFL